MVGLFFKALNRNRFKTFLIYLSITVAITAIFMITSISRGIIGMYSTMLKSDGDIIVTQAKIADTFFSDVNISLAEKIKNIAGVKEVYALILGASPINDLPIAAIYGVSENRFKTYRLTEGAYPKKAKSFWVRTSTQDCTLQNLSLFLTKLTLFQAYLRMVWALKMVGLCLTEKMLAPFLTKKRLSCS